MDVRIRARVLSNAKPMFNTLGIEVTTGRFEVRSASSVCVNMECVLAWWKSLKLSVHQDSTRHSIKFDDAVILSFTPLIVAFTLACPPANEFPAIKAEHKRTVPHPLMRLLNFIFQYLRFYSLRALNDKGSQSHASTSWRESNLFISQRL